MGEGGEEGREVEVVMPMPVDRMHLQMGGRNGFVRYSTVLIERYYHTNRGCKRLYTPSFKSGFPSASALISTRGIDKIDKRGMGAVS